MEPNLDRLQTLLDYLRTQVVVERFDLRDWFVVNMDSENLLNAQIGDCGTSACAIGYACVIPEFNQAGFSMRNLVTPCYRFTLSTGELVEYSHWEAVENFFGITKYDARFMFDYHYGHNNGDKRNTLEATCARIQTLIDSYRQNDALY